MCNALFYTNFCLYLCTMYTAYHWLFFYLFSSSLFFVLTLHRTLVDLLLLSSHMLYEKNMLLNWIPRMLWEVVIAIHFLLTCLENKCVSIAFFINLIIQVSTKNPATQLLSPPMGLSIICAQWSKAWYITYNHMQFSFYNHWYL